MYSYSSQQRLGKVVGRMTLMELVSRDQSAMWDR
jgi:hypothetical protein